MVAFLLLEMEPPNLNFMLRKIKAQIKKLKII